MKTRLFSTTGRFTFYLTLFCVIGLCTAAVVFLAHDLLSPGGNANGASAVAAKPATDAQAVTVDLGVVLAGSKTERVVKLRNESPSTISVKKVQSDCGCMTDKVDPETIPAGATYEFTIHYTAPDGNGTIQRRLLLTFNEAGSIPVLVSVTGQVRQWAEANLVAINFGEVLCGQATVKPLTITSFSKRKLQMEDFQAHLPHLKPLRLRVDEGVRQADGQEATVYSLDMELSPPLDAKPGALLGDVVVQSGEPAEKLIVPCRAAIIQPVTAEPGSWFLGFVRPEESYRAAIRVRRKETATGFSWRDVRVVHDLGQEFDAKAVVGPDPMELELQCCFRPEKRSGARSGSIRIEAGGQLRVEIPGSAYVR
jgi:Protein of unknown function (DUF1573)